MKTYYLNYLSSFKCVAKNCKHSCCKGWQIDIDKKSLTKYAVLNGNDTRFRNNVDYERGIFLQNENGDCKFLDGSGLCQIITDYGESFLCKTCKFHPRFINYFNGVKEIGGGLCCEEIARLILSQKKRLVLTDMKTDKKVGAKLEIIENLKLTDFEKDIIRFREKAIKIVQDRKERLSERIYRLISLCKTDVFSLSIGECVALFKTTEKLAENRDKYLDLVLKRKVELKDLNFDREEYEISYEQILSYFIFRRIPLAMDTTDLCVQTAFCVWSFLIILSLFSVFVDNKDGLIEACRFYSTEIEYSENNVNTVLTKLETILKLC